MLRCKQARVNKVKLELKIVLNKLTFEKLPPIESVQEDI
jgi:hypothetical protein